MANNWRSVKWKDFSSNKKLWFVLLCVQSVILLALAVLCGAGIFYIPNWAAGIYIISAAVVLYKFMNEHPLLFDDSGADKYDECDEDDDEDEES